ncbi:MAG: hypothetical protein RLZZ165_1473 [Bacteroidota bacterium]|jgi:hypothetical protein
MSEKKREWWPVGIIAAFVLFIGGVLTAVMIMVRNDVPLTSADYYARELAYQEQIDKSRRGLAPSQKPEVKPLAATQAVEIVFPGRKTASQFEGKATFFRPSDPSKDFSLALQPDEAGRQWVGMRDRTKGLWLLQLEWSENGTAYYYEEPFHL